MNNKSLFYITTWITMSITLPAWAEIKTGSDCDGKCTWYYDTETKDLTVKKNEGADGDIILRENYPALGAIHDMTIGSGITGYDKSKVFGFYTGSGKLSIPSTLRLTYGTYPGAFKTLEVESVKSLGDASVMFYANKKLSVIITPEENVFLDPDSFGRSPNKSLNITMQCKGDWTLCNNMLSKIKNKYLTSGVPFSIEGYKEYDDNGRLIEAWDENGHYVNKYDAGGNLVAVYENGVATYRRRIYTSSEATAAASGNKNKFSITYR